MSISTTAAELIYDCNGATTAFPVTYEYLQDEFLLVRRKDADTLELFTLVLGVDYTVVSDEVVTVETYPTGDTIYIALIVPLTQLVDLLVNGIIDSNVLEGALDKLTLIAQQTSLDRGNVIGISAPEDPVPDFELPGAAERASRYLAFDSNGDVVVVTTIDTGTITFTPYGEALVGVVDAAAARTLLGVYSEAETDSAIDTDVAASEADLGGTGRTTETIKGNADDIVNLAGAGRTTETIKGNADDISTNAASVAAIATVVDVANSEVVSDTARFEGLSHLMPKSVAVVGNSLALATVVVRVTALSATRVVLYLEGTGFKVYDFDGTDWSQVGNTLANASITDAGLVALTSSRIVIVDEVANTMTTYDFDGTDFSIVGNALSVTNQNTYLAALSSTRIAMYNLTGDFLSDYTFDGTDWTIGTSLNIGSASSPTITALSDGEIAYLNHGDSVLRKYKEKGSSNGLTWGVVGSTFSFSGFGQAHPVALSSNLIVLISSIANIFFYYFNGTTWIRVLTAVYPASSAGCITALSHDMFVTASGSNGLQAHQITYDGAPASLAFGSL